MSEICAFGDSILKGVILENDKYKVSKNRFTNLCENAFGIVIENKAKFGSTISVGEKSFEKNIDILDDENIQYVVLEFGGNDCNYNWNEISDNPDIEHLPNNTIEEFNKIYTKVIQQVKEKGKTPVLISLPPVDSVKYINYISKDLNKDNIIKWMNGDLQFLTNWHERYNIEVFKLAIANNISIIDITSKFLELKNYTELLCSDGIHPNEEGHKIIADAIKEHVERKNIKFN